MGGHRELRRRQERLAAMRHIRERQGPASACIEPPFSQKPHIRDHYLDAKSTTSDNLTASETRSEAGILHSEATTDLAEIISDLTSDEELSSTATFSVAMRELLDSVQQGRRGALGVCRLQHEAIDTLLPSSWLCEQRLSHSGLRPPTDATAWLALEPTLTLTAAAAALCKDGPLAQLIFARADPTRRCRHSFARAANEAAAARAREAMRCVRAPAIELLAALPPAYACWLMRAIVRMRAAGAEAVCSARQRTEPLALCARCGEQALPPVCWGQPCMHIFCEACVWDSLIHEQRDTAEMTCMASGCGLRRPEAPAYSDDASSLPGKETSRALFETLPLLLSDATPKPKPPKFGAISSLLEASAAMPGRTREQRTAEAFKACEAGSLQRLRALLREGVDVDCVNEYGQTPLAVASEFSRTSIVRLLLDLSADTAVRANDGVTTAALGASARGHNDVVRMLAAHDASIESNATGASTLRQALCVESSPSATARVPAGGDGRTDGGALYESSGNGESVLRGTPCSTSGHGRYNLKQATAVTDGKTLDDSDTAKLQNTASSAVSEEMLEACDVTATANNRAVASFAAPTSCACTCLIRPEADHDGAGSYYIDDALPEEILDRLLGIFRKLPVAPDVKVCSNQRRYYNDSTGWLSASIGQALQRHAGAAGVSACFRRFRFLEYAPHSGGLPPHIDLVRTDPLSHVRSTHTLILYLSSCPSGGQTVLLDPQSGPPRATVSPMRNRLLLFPHRCLHEARPTDSYKLLLRGELY